MFERMSVNQFYPRWLSACENGKPGIFVDVRSTEEYSAGHVPGSKHIPLHTLPLRAAEIPGDKPVYLICHAGGRSAQAAMFLAQNQGLRNLINVEGGTAAWIAAGYPVE